MKLRGDFVTNSSSVSFILTMKEDMINIRINEFADSGRGEFYKFLRDKIKNEGQKTVLNGEELCSLKLTFDTDDALPLEGFEIDELNFEAMRKLDLSILTDKELNSFLNWAILNPQLLYDFGLTRVDTY